MLLEMMVWETRSLRNTRELKPTAIDMP